MASRVTKTRHSRHAERAHFNGPPASPSKAVRPSDEEVRLAAYLKWVAANCPPGDGVEFWLEAERELNRRVP
jgi:hypothetical protein